MPVFCHHCGAKLSGDSRFCPGCGASITAADPGPDVRGSATEPTPVPSKSALPPASAIAPPLKRYPRLKIGFLAILVVIVLVVIAHNVPSKEQQAQQANSIVLPPLEASFISIVAKAQNDSRQTDNDMQKGGVKAKRDKSICNAMTSFQVQDWIGTVQKIDSNSDGKGVLEILIAPDVVVKTWNNAVSDISSNTLIEPGSPVFESASAMKHGQLAVFSGTFFQGQEGDCIGEGSLSLGGKLQSPEFIFRFSKISPYSPPSQPIQASQQPNPAPIQDSKASAAAQQTPSLEQLKAMADKQAAPLLEQLKAKPNDPALLAQVGNLYFDAQSFPLAIDYYQKSLATDPKNSNVRADLGTSLFHTNDPDRAIAELDQALKDDPENSNALSNRGVVKWQGKNDVNGAIADWELLLKQNPNYARADQVRMSIEQAKKQGNIK